MKGKPTCNYNANKCILLIRKFPTCNPSYLPTQLLSARQGNKFKVPTGNLVFSVILYTVSASMCQVLLMVRRCYVGELGGSKISKYLCGAFLITLWFLYIIISSLQTYGIIKVQMWCHRCQTLLPFSSACRSVLFCFFYWWLLGFLTEIRERFQIWMYSFN